MRLKWQINLLIWSQWFDLFGMLFFGKRTERFLFKVGYFVIVEYLSSSSPGFTSHEYQLHKYIPRNGKLNMSINDVLLSWALKLASLVSTLTELAFSTF